MLKALAILFISITVQAKLVPETVSFSMTSRGQQSHYDLNFAFGNYISIGYNTRNIDLIDGDTISGNYGQLNVKLLDWTDRRGKRAHAYLSAGTGKFSNKTKSGILSSYAGHFDYIDPIYYFSITHYQLITEAQDPYQTTSRLGASAYIAFEDELRTYVLIQHDQAPDIYDETQLSVVISLMYRQYIGEIGTSFNGESWLFLGASF